MKKVNQAKENAYNEGKKLGENGGVAHDSKRERRYLYHRAYKAGNKAGLALYHTRQGIQ